MRSLSLLRFDERLATTRPRDALDRLNDLNPIPVEFGSEFAVGGAVGWGRFSSAFHCNETSGNLIGGIGGINLTPISSPTYRNPGPRGGISDYAVGFDSVADAFTAGNQFNLIATTDLAIAGTIYFDTITGGGDIIGKGFVGGVGAGYYLAREGAELSCYFTDGANTQRVAVGISAATWYDFMLAADRSTNQIAIARAPVTTGAVAASTPGSIAAVGSPSSASSWNLGDNGTNRAFVGKVSDLYIGASVGAANGLVANISTALANLSAALRSVTTVVDAAAGRGRSFVALSGHGFEAADVVAGSTLATRDVSVQALVRWDLADQAALEAWQLDGSALSWNGYARAAETLDGDLQLDMTIPALGTFVMVGFRRASDATEGITGFGRYWYINQNAANQLSVWEGSGAVFNAGASTYAVGDQLRVVRTGNVFQYWHRPLNGVWTLKYTGVTDANSMNVSFQTDGVGGMAGIRLWVNGVRKPVSWKHLVAVDATPSDHRGAIYVRGKGSNASEYHSAGMEVRVVNAAAAVGELAWLWQTTAGVLKRQIGAPFAVPSGVAMLTATRRWASSSSVILRYYLGGQLLSEIESTDGDIGGGTTGTTTIGARFDGTAWGDYFDGVIDELRVVDYELTAEEIKATWDRITKYQPLGYDLVKQLHPPDFPISDNPTSRVQRETNLIGQALGYAGAQAENLRSNLLPDRAYGAVLEQWENILAQPPKPGDSVDTRRARVVGRLRQRAGVSIPGVQAALKDLVSTAVANLEIVAFPQEITEQYDRPEVWNLGAGVKLERTAGGGAAWDAGIASVETISGDGYIETIVVETGKSRMFGFGVVDSSVNYTDIDYAMFASSGGTLEVHENGVQKFLGLAYAAGDVLRVRRVGSMVSYEKNGVTFYTSLTASSGAVMVDTSFFHLNSTLQNLRLFAIESTRIREVGLSWQNNTSITVTVEPFTPSTTALRAQAANGADLQFVNGATNWLPAQVSISSAPAYRTSLGLPAQGWGAHILTKIVPTTLPNRGEVGIAFFDRTRNHYFLFGLRNNAGTYQIITERFISFVSQGVTVRATTTLVNHWLHLFSEAPSPVLGGAIDGTTWNLTAAWSTTSSTAGFTSYTTLASSARFQWCALYQRSFGGTLAAALDMTFDETRLFTPYGDRSLRFYAFRDPALTGTPDTIGARNILQGLKQAHTEATFISSKPLLYDSDGHGYGLGPLGGY